MFTGLDTRTIGRVTETTGLAAQRLETGSASPRRIAGGRAPAVGESIAVDGVCLTVARAFRGDRFYADVVAGDPELAHHSRASSGRAREGQSRAVALSLGDRLGGHLVQGHVDEHRFCERSAARQEGGRLHGLRIRSRTIHDRRSYIAIQGLRRVERRLPDGSGSWAEGWFEVALVPFRRFDETTLGGLCAPETEPQCGGRSSWRAILNV